MNWRSIATLGPGAAVFVAFVGIGAFSIASLAPKDAILALPRAPSLVNLATTPVSLAVAALPEPRPLVRTTLEGPISVPRPAPAEPAPESTGALVIGSAEALAPTRRQRGADAIISDHLGEAPPRPDVRTLPSRAAHAALSQPDATGTPPQRNAPVAPPISISPSAAPRPPVAARPAPDPRFEGVLTLAEIGRLRQALRLTSDQFQHWPAVEVILREMGARQIALVRAGRKPEEAFSGGITGRLYWAARPLLGVLREDQKAVIRRRAHSMGFESVASMI